MMTRRQFTLGILSGLLMGGVVAMPAHAELPADFQAKVDKYMPQMQQWAALPEVVAAAKAGTPATGMTNAKWGEMPATDAAVTGILGSTLSKKLAGLQTNDLGKLILRDKSGDLVASPEKPFLFNIAKRPNFQATMEGKVFVAGKVAPDPSTNKPSVQVAVPVKDGEVIVGMLHASIE